MTTYDAWVLSRILVGMSVEGVDDVSRKMRPLAERLLAVGTERRDGVLDGFAVAQDDPDSIVQSILDADPEGPEPERGGGAPAGATLADVCRLQSDRSWPWLGWMPRGVLTALASDPGVGKTLLAMTLSRNLWEGRPLPDAQAPTSPPGTRTLWIAGDHHFGQLAEVAEAYGLPPEAMLLNGTVEEPTGGMFLDDPDTLQALDNRVADEAPGLVVIDTVGMTTDRNLGRAEDARQYFQSLMKVAMKHGVPFLLLTHLSKDANAPLGRRIVGACRVVWKLTRPDPENQPDRRRLWVEKSYAIVPPALGMTIAAGGCTFDAVPPEEPPANIGGRPNRRLEECKRWLIDYLTDRQARVKDVRSDGEQAGFNSSTLYRAYEAIGGEEYTVERRKWWRLPATS